MRHFLKWLFGKNGKLEAVKGVPATTTVLGQGYDNEYPMLPKEVVYKAVDGGFDFHGSLGPENILNYRFFEALASGYKPPEGVMVRYQTASGRGVVNPIEARARQIADRAFEFYLDAFLLPREEAQIKAKEFWSNLLKI